MSDGSTGIDPMEKRIDAIPPDEGLVWQNRQLKKTILAYKKEIDELKKDLKQARHDAEYYQFQFSQLGGHSQ